MIHARRQSYARDSTADQGVAQGEPSRQPGLEFTCRGTSAQPFTRYRRRIRFAPHCKANCIVRSKEQNMSPLSGNPSHELWRRVRNPIISDSSRNYFPQVRHSVLSMIKKNKHTKIFKNSSFYKCHPSVINLFFYK